MRVRYRCKVQGRMRVPFAFEVPSGPIRYDFETGAHGELKAIIASVAVPDRRMWPIVRPAGTPGVKLEIALSRPFFEVMRQHLRGIEGMLSLFGLDALDIENAEESWDPESDEEKEQLQLFGFKRERQPVPIEQRPVTPFDMVVRACLAAPQAQSVEAALSFFRKGKNDVIEERYLEAVYDFLFMIESWYAAGKFKSAQVEREYLRNAELQGAIAGTVNEPTLLSNVLSDSRIQAAFQRDYAGKSPEDITHHLVELRGFVHHHSKGDKGRWHPDDHVRFGADAYFLQQLCFRVAFGLIKPLMYAPEQTARTMELHRYFLEKAGSQRTQ